ncbi:late control protein D [Cereibacter changlensis]|uniref:Late control protein D n=1 Tax=Cereibacter changlensis TaxID=402884 RepID=A0A4U0YTQ4_9RHOB|nr:late control protein D [Cereibacter changlensis]
MAGLRPEFIGDWHLEQVTHQLTDGGLVTGFRARTSAPQERGNNTEF